jgi:hypothetical protein
MPSKHFHRLPPFPRRAVLRGTLGGLGVVLALPTLEAMLDSHGTAYAQEGAFPKRFGFFFFGDGVRLEHWTPRATGAAWELTPSLMPLAGVKDYVSVISGTEVKTEGRVHHNGQCALATGGPFIEQDPGGANYASTFGHRSIDQLIAEAWAETSPVALRSLELGISERLTRAEGSTLNFFSHNGPDNPNQPQFDPRAVFDRLFTDSPGASGPDGAQPDPRWALRKSVLDAVRQGALELQPRLGSTDRQRLQQHLDSIRALETKLSAFENGTGSAACRKPEPPAELPDPDEGEPLVERSELHAELLATALACDLTRVFTIQFSGGVSNTVFPELNLNRGRHGLSHDEGDDQPGMQASTVYIMERFAAFLNQLKATPEGAGNLLDGCAIMCSSDVAEGRSHSKDDYPVLVAGKAGGTLVHPGIHHRSDGSNTSDIHFTVLTALGLDVPSFGHEAGESSTRIPGLSS